MSPQVTPFVDGNDESIVSTVLMRIPLTFESWPDSRPTTRARRFIICDSIIFALAPEDPAQFLSWGGRGNICSDSRSGVEKDGRVSVLLSSASYFARRGRASTWTHSTAYPKHLLDLQTTHTTKNIRNCGHGIIFSSFLNSMRYSPP